jgi:cysteinyl-tRNA synthetase
MLEEAKAAGSRIINCYKDLNAYLRNAPEGDADSQDCCDVIEQYRQAFRDAMDDDFNTRQAIEVIFQMVRAVNKAMGERTLCKRSAQKHIELLDEFNGILNIIPQEEGGDDSLDDVMSILIDLRSELRKNKMYDLADMIRDRLKDAGIVLEDSKDGVKWKKA